MEITHLCNSFLYLRIGKTKLVCDPWVGSTFDNSWVSTPINLNGVKIMEEINPNYIYISHLHCDHFDIKLLKGLKNKNSVIIIKKFKIPILKNRILKLGFRNILEIDPWKIKKINEDISVSIVPQSSNNNESIDGAINYDLDTSIIIKSNKSKKIFYNNVDNPMNNNDLKKVRTFIKKKMKSKINICSLNVGAASEYPQCFLNIDRKKEKDRIVNISLQNIKKRLDALGAKFFFTSGGAYKIGGKYYNLNKYISFVHFKKIKNLALKKHHAFDLFGGKTVILKKNKFILKKSIFKNYISKSTFRNLKYSYESKNNINLKKLDTLFKKSLLNYNKTLSKFNIPSSWNIKLYIYENLKLNNVGRINMSNSKIVRLYKFNYQKKKRHCSMILHLDCNLLFNLLTKKIPWNPAISGSFIMFERRPNLFYPDLTASLNFLTI